jgi:hypothetical protein
MQKLTGISSDKNKNSCRIIHHESKKIGCTFFCDFLRNLQESGNPFYYWSSSFAAGTLERMLALQCGPWARLDDAGEPIAASSLVLVAGGGQGGGLGLLGARFGVLDRAKVAPASSSPAAREGRPRWDWFRRGSETSGATKGGGSFYGF